MEFSGNLRDRSITVHSSMLGVEVRQFLNARSKRAGISISFIRCLLPALRTRVSRTNRRGFMPDVICSRERNRSSRPSETFEAPSVRHRGSPADAPEHRGSHRARVRFVRVRPSGRRAGGVSCNHVVAARHCADRHSTQVLQRIGFNQKPPGAITDTSDYRNHNVRRAPNGTPCPCSGCVEFRRQTGRAGQVGCHRSRGTQSRARA